MARTLITSLAGLHDDDSLTLYDVAAILKVEYSTAYERTKSGQIEFFRVGKCIRVEVRALRAFIEQRRRGGATRSPNSFITLKKRAG